MHWSVVGIGVAGNQPEECEMCLANLGITFDLIGSSARWGVKKPNTEFFRRLIDETNLSPAEICYVGDHPENDLIPARALGLKTIFIKRGPWGFAFADHSSVRNASAQVATLLEIPHILHEWRRATA